MSLFNSNLISIFFFFNDTATTEIYTLSLHDALPLSSNRSGSMVRSIWMVAICHSRPSASSMRSEEHTSELQSLRHLVCRLLIEKKKKNRIYHTTEKQKLQKKKTNTTNTK